MFGKLAGAALLVLTLAPTARAQHVVTGTIRTDAGGWVAGARVAVVGSAATAVSDSAGRFRIALRGSLGAAITVRVSGVSAAPVDRTVAVRRDTIVVDFVLPSADHLADHVVEDGPVRDYAVDMRDVLPRAPTPVADGAAFAGSGRRGASAGRRGGRTGSAADLARVAELAGAGVLTAAVWDDLAHWTEYSRYLESAGQAGENDWQLDPSHARKPTAIAKGRARAALDLGFLVDATGSMGDEMQFLQTELRDIVTRVRESEPELDIRISIVFYRDRGDEFLTKALPFTRSLDSAVAFLGSTTADGGGDYPEDMNAGFDTMMRQDWSRDVAPRMLFVIGDAPPQRYQDERYTYREAIGDASANRIALYPVAASGIDKSTEYLFRAMAAMTGGKYVFLTDDSGVGESHEKPDITGYEVEKLNELMVREIRKYVRSYLAPMAVAAK